MPKEQREPVDIEAYLKMFKQAHITQAISTSFWVQQLYFGLGTGWQRFLYQYYPLLFLRLFPLQDVPFVQAIKGE